MYANIALWRIAICSPILLAIRKSERDVDVSDLKRKFPENSRVKYIQQIDMLLHTGILFPNPHQPVFIPNPVPTCLYPRPCANLSLFLLLNAKVLSREAANTNDVIVFDPRSIAGER